jgi:endoglucanase
MNRRKFIQSAATVTALAYSSFPILAAIEAKPAPSARKLPRWRGFNLLEKFTKRRDGNPAFLESDFAAISDWGFDFARLPMSYLCWTDPRDWRKLQEAELVHVDQAIEFGRKHGVHVNLNFHRAPGYCVNPPKEPKDLWSDSDALETCAYHWGQFARRYKGIPNDRLSFDLLNEPADIKEDVYVRVVTRLVESIREQDPTRLIIADGLCWGTNPVFGLTSLGVGQSTRGYAPMQISHYRASWISGSDKWPEPTWPLQNSNAEGASREKLREQRILPWKKLEEKGVGIHVGEWGAFNQTPHAVALAWMHDCLDLWKEAGWGWALWNFRGSFGILDSDRKDVNYETWQGHKLDREMLKLLQAG